MSKTLEELLKGLDESNPHSMSTITMYKNQLGLEDDEFMDLLVQKLCNESITWNQPWYQKSMGLTRPKQQDNSDPFDTSRIRKDEAEIIDKNWQKLIKKYEIPDKPICFARWRHKSNIKNGKSPTVRIRNYVTAYLARGLKRNLYQVYKNFVTTNFLFKKGPYTNIEEKVISICLKYEPQKACTIISYVLNRSPRQLYTKIGRVNNGHIKEATRSQFKHKWDLDNASEFLKLLLKHTELPLKKLKNREIEKEVWTKIDEEMTLGVHSLKCFWYNKLHQQLFIKKGIKLKRLQKEVYALLRTKLDTLKVWTDIDWREIVKELPVGLTKEFVYQIAYRPIRYNKSAQKMPLEEVLDLVNEKLSKRKSKKKIKRLMWTKDEELVRVNGLDDSI